MKTMREIAFIFSLAALSSVSLSSANALAKAPLSDSFKVSEVVSLQPTPQRPVFRKQEPVPHKVTVAQSVASFPLTGSSTEEEVGREQYMQTNITISNTGRIDGVTATRTTRKTNGFVGVVEVILTDKDGNILFITPQQRFAVEGRFIPGPSKRTDRWQVDIPAEVLNQVSGYVIAQRNSNAPSFNATAEKIRDLIKIFL
ncbi:MAG: hypothetical protein KME32_05795 [Mojavia pulchra JT2-VF2]|jgi:hypothetical protein|uniref:Uncharacterized protein n=1 Tax=Mojavia pulchra JT2-VF2 TaxID=287848 RepID=A0A951PWD5_9NOST|nr:hypothetical protein [Mojavia pulchra JT2-VF2]